MTTTTTSKLVLPEPLKARLASLNVEPKHVVGIFLVDHENGNHCTVMVFHDPDIGEEEWDSPEDVPVAYQTADLLINYLGRLTGDDEILEPEFEHEESDPQQLSLDLNEWNPDGSSN